MPKYPITIREGDSMHGHNYPSKVLLKWYEVSTAIHIVGLRHTESLRKSMQDKHGYKGRDMQDNLYGVLGEIAFAKATNTYFPMTVNTFKDADVGIDWQVRTVGSNKNRDLIVSIDSIYINPNISDLLFFNISFSNISLINPRK